jgi:hypothetical protein
MAATYESIATTTLGSAATSITFSSIPSTYTDLRVVFVGTQSTGTACFVRLNSDTGTNYSYTYLWGNGSSVGSGRAINEDWILIDLASGFGSTYPAMFQMDLFSYAGSTFKTMLVQNSNDKNGSGSVERSVRLWRSTSAINTISINSYNAANFAIGTTATLYGIKNA